MNEYFPVFSNPEPTALCVKQLQLLLTTEQLSSTPTWPLIICLSLTISKIKSFSIYFLAKAFPLGSFCVHHLTDSLFQMDSKHFPENKNAACFGNIGILCEGPYLPHGDIISNSSEGGGVALYLEAPFTSRLLLYAKYILHFLILYAKYIFSKQLFNLSLENRKTFFYGFKAQP